MSRLNWQLMDDTDAFFTHTIVGAPFTTVLGKRLPSGRQTRDGVKINLETGDSFLTVAWRDWLVLSHQNDPTGLPRRRPGRIRRWLERHALWLALTGIASLLATAAYWGHALCK